MKTNRGSWTAILWIIILLFLRSQGRPECGQIGTSAVGATATSVPSPSHFRRILRQTWERGGVCRHAAVAVCLEAAKYDLECKMPLWYTGNGGSHVIPSVLMPDGRWHTFEMFNTFGASSKSSRKPPSSCSELRRFSDRKCFYFIGFAEENKNRNTEWFSEAIEEEFIKLEEFKWIWERKN